MEAGNRSILRTLIIAVLAAGIWLPACKSAQQEEPDPASSEQPAANESGEETVNGADEGDAAEAEQGDIAGNDKEDEDDLEEIDATDTDYAEIPTGPDGKPKPLTLRETIKLVLDNNNSVRIQQLEILKSDTELLKEESKYTPKVDFTYQSLVRKDVPTPQTLFSGTQTNQDAYILGLEKLFETGTYFRVEGSDTRFDNNAGEDVTALFNPLISSLAQPPLHTGALKVILQQELLKNAFGYSQRRINDIKRKQSQIQREELEYQLAQLTVKAMVDYWSLSIAEQELQTAQNLYRNTANIRAITAQKLGIGLAERFELNQWNALLSQAAIQLDQANLDRDAKRRELLRTLNLDPDLQLTGATDLVQDPPENTNRERDIQQALDSRPDLAVIRKQMEIARLSRELADNNLLPSVKIGGSYASRDVGRQAETAFYHVPRGTYPEMTFQFKVEYPLWDEGARVDARNARINLKQLSLREKEITRQVEDDIRNGYDQTRAAYRAVNQSRNALYQTQAYYNGLVVRYRQGRFSADAIKQALDQLVQARQAYTRALINYNITLLRYDLARDVIWQKYNIDIDAVIDRMKVDD